MKQTKIAEVQVWLLWLGNSTNHNGYFIHYEVFYKSGAFRKFFAEEPPKSVVDFIHHADFNEGSETPNCCGDYVTVYNYSNCPF